MSPAADLARAALRADLLFIADLIDPGSRVLDIGCGDGALLHYLSSERGVDGRGIEISQAGVNACVSHGLSVIQGNADTDLNDYPDGAFDYVVLSRTLQATRNPREVLAQLVRIGRKAIVTFPNFGYWRVRWNLIALGQMPTTRLLSDPWYSTENIHLCTIRDFTELCDDLGLHTERQAILNHTGRNTQFRSTSRFANFFGEQALFMLSQR
ncbi:MAG: methionine biosynthesis protein MetW [Alphaproteobacteria bacterium]|nr:methionine biosynthesis protein MetW [Alphaproteobacteria bacterium]